MQSLIRYTPPACYLHQFLNNFASVHYEFCKNNLKFQVPSLFSFDNGNVGVNFLGFKASAGLGGLLSGNAAAGGLHAEAGTPFGQAAKAGLGGNIDGKGKNYHKFI